jgi:hypothetical protein
VWCCGVAVRGFRHKRGSLGLIGTGLAVMRLGALGALSVLGLGRGDFGIRGAVLGALGRLEVRSSSALWLSVLAMYRCLAGPGASTARVYYCAWFRACPLSGPFVAYWANGHGGISARCAMAASLTRNSAAFWDGMFGPILEFGISGILDGIRPQCAAWFATLRLRQQEDVRKACVSGKAI